MKRPAKTKPVSIRLAAGPKCGVCDKPRRGYPAPIENTPSKEHSAERHGAPLLGQAMHHSYSPGFSFPYFLFGFDNPT